MALYPCDFCHSRYTGAQQAAYPAVMLGSNAIRGKKRACQACFFKLVSFAADYLDDASTASHIPTRCCICGEEAEDMASVFLTSYAHRADRQDFFGRSCRGCLAAVGMALFGAAGAVEPLLD